MEAEAQEEQSRRMIGMRMFTLINMVRGTNPTSKRPSSYLVTQQAATWPGSACFCSRGGASIWHFLRTRKRSPADSISTVSAAFASVAACLVRGHRGWKAQPVGGLLGLGTSPLRMILVVLGWGSGSGIAESSDMV